MEKPYIHLRGIFNYSEIEKLKQAFKKALEYCESCRSIVSPENNSKNTIHHAFFLDPIFQELIQKESLISAVREFFSGANVVLNSFGGNNNTEINYARTIHRDVRFTSSFPIVLNTIWCISPLNSLTGATEIMPNSEHMINPPDESEFSSSATSVEAEPGDVILFDSRLFHRAGVPQESLKERIIFTPMYSLPFFKPGFDYLESARDCGYDIHDMSDYLKGLIGYRSDTPKNHFQWYGERRFYEKSEDSKINGR
jgi:ectoine hydroxylase-related dioxygenase (phytanoyl-CoA dioxygenase family)